MTKQKLEKRKFKAKNGLIDGEKLEKTLEAENTGFGPEATDANLRMMEIVRKLHAEKERQELDFGKNNTFVRIRVSGIGNMFSWTTEHKQLFKISGDGLSILTALSKADMKNKPYVYMIEDLESVKVVPKTDDVIKLLKNKNLKTPGRGRQT